MTNRVYWPAAGLLSALILGHAGCAVPQPPGNGVCQRLVEPETQTGYWLYLPEDYVANKGNRPDRQRWPVVVTLHGLKPYDNAHPQVRCWQQEADRYGFIVIAPELQTCDSVGMQFPLRDPNLPYVQRDEKAVLAILDEVYRRTNADPERVLSTSFSSGGYMAHYLVNRYPERFSCLAVRGSNFNEEMLNTAQLPKYRNMKIGIFFGENDFKVCREESMRAVAWYRKYHFDVEAKKVAGLGHERRPQTAAAFFAATIGVTPKTPPDLGALVMQEVVPVPAYRPASRRPLQPRPASPRAMPSSNDPGSRTPVHRDAIFNEATTSPPAPRTTEPTQVAPARSPARTTTPIRTAPGRSTSPTPKRPTAQPYSLNTTPAGQTAAPGTGDPARKADTDPAAPGAIRVLGRRVAPMWAHLALDLPADLARGASVLWTDNGKPIGTGRFDTQSILWEPGPHAIAAHVTLADNRKLTFRNAIDVTAAASSQPATN